MNTQLSSSLDTGSRSGQMPSLDHPAYTTTVRRGWHGNTRPVSALTVVTASDGKHLLRRFMPNVGKFEHRILAGRHMRASIEHCRQWSALVDAASMEVFGRNFLPTDYRISAIAREEFSEEHKQALRRHSYAEANHHQLAVLHYMAAGHQHHTALRLCREHRTRT